MLSKGERQKTMNNTISYESWAHLCERQHVLESINRFTYNVSLLYACWMLDFLLKIVILSLFVGSYIWNVPLFEYFAVYSNECHSFFHHDVRNHSMNIACKICFSGKVTSNVFSVEIPKFLYVWRVRDGWMLDAVVNWNSLSVRNIVTLGTWHSVPKCNQNVGAMYVIVKYGNDLSYTWILNILDLMEKPGSHPNNFWINCEYCFNTENVIFICYLFFGTVVEWKNFLLCQSRISNHKIISEKLKQINSALRWEMRYACD